MSILTNIDTEHATGKAKELLTAVKKTMGATPNIFTAFANAPAALDAYLAFNTSLSQGALNAQLREKLALVTAGFNGCNYCASAHVFLGDKAGIDNEELKSNLQGKSQDVRDQAALTFALQLIEKRGRVDETELQAIRAAGFSDEEIIEILAHVALNTFTNYFNEAFQTEIDFPKVDINQIKN